MFFVMRTPYGLRIYSFFGKFWQKNFFDPRVPPWGVNFSMVKIFSNFVFFVMRSPYKLRIYSSFEKCRQKIFSRFEVPRVPLGVSIFRWLQFFLILCFLWWGPHMNSEYIVCLQNFDKKFFRPPNAPGSPLGILIFRWIKFFLLLCFSWWGPLVDSEYLVCLENFDKKFFDLPSPKGPLGCFSFDGRNISYLYVFLSWGPIWTPDI